MDAGLEIFRSMSPDIQRLKGVEGDGGDHFPVDGLNSGSNEVTRLILWLSWEELSDR